MDWGASDLQVLGEITLAMVLGGLIGFERAAANKPAGARTQMLVAGASAMLVRLGDAVLVHYGLGERAGIQSDPFRIVGAIITGVSFLGAGSIIRGGRSSHVEGLTTGASLLFSSAVGIAVALRHFVLAVGVTVLTLVVLRGFGLLEDWMLARSRRR